jgi:hypothetical protein
MYEVGILATYAREARKIGEPTNAQAQVWLAAVLRRSRALENVLERLPDRVRELIDGPWDNSRGLGVPLLTLEGALWHLEEVIPLAQRKVNARRGPRERTVERRAADDVRRLFEQYGLLFRPADDRQSPRKNAPSVCLRLILGLVAHTRVDHYFRK